MTSSDDDEGVEIPEHVKRYLDERHAEHRRIIEAFERELVLEGWEDEEVFEKVASEEKIVRLDNARDRRDGSQPPPYTKMAVEELVEFYLERATWLEAWLKTRQEEVER